MASGGCTPGPPDLGEVETPTPHADLVGHGPEKAVQVADQCFSWCTGILHREAGEGPATVVKGEITALMEEGAKYGYVGEWQQKCKALRQHQPPDTLVCGGPRKALASVSQEVTLLLPVQPRPAHQLPSFPP